MKLIYVFCLNLILNNTPLVTFNDQISGPLQDDWKLLADVRIEKRWDDLIQDEQPFPIFGNDLLASDGKIIELTGYMVPLDELMGQNNFVLSSLPFQTCFFCGGAGPETVAEIKTRKSVSYSDKRIKVRGVLRLNDKDPLRLYYTLENSEVFY